MDWTTLAASALDKASSAASFGKGVASGAGEGAVSMAEGLWSLGKGAVNVGSRLATDSAYRQAAAEQTRALANSAVEYGGQLIDDPATRAQAYEQVQHLAGSLKQEFLDAQAQAERDGKLSEFYGRVVGRGGFEVAAFVVPAAKLSALGKVGSAAKVGEAADLAKAAKTADAVSSVKAGQAVQPCEAVASSKSLVPSGGLSAHEAAGGHLLEKHVGQSEAALRARLAAEPRISGSSSFTDLQTAEHAVAETLAAKKAEIDTWLSSSSNRLRLDHSLQETVGHSVDRGVAGIASVGSARVILVRDAAMSTGYKILTGYPTKP